MWVAVECWSSLRPRTKICFFSHLTSLLERKPALPTPAQPQPSDMAAPLTPPPHPPMGASEWPEQAPSVCVQPLRLLAEQRLTSTLREVVRQGEDSLPAVIPRPPTALFAPPALPGLSAKTLAERRRTCKRLSNSGGSHSAHFWRRFKTLPGNLNRKKEVHSSPSLKRKLWV